MQKKAAKVLTKLEKRRKLEKEKNLPVEKRLRSIPRETGIFFNILLKALKAKRILEIGTSQGYSTIWLGLVVKENGGKVISLENNPESYKNAVKNIREAGLDKVMQIILGDAKETIKKLSGPFDFVFIDAEKVDYITYFDLVFPKVKKNGLIMADNIISHFEILKDFKEYVEKIPQVESMVVPIGTGEMMCLKVK
jgi:predicted O-methyltransferase YrrM